MSAEEKLRARAEKRRQRLLGASKERIQMVAPGADVSDLQTDGFDLDSAPEVRQFVASAPAPAPASAAAANPNDILARLQRKKLEARVRLGSCLLLGVGLPLVGPALPCPAYQVFLLSFITILVFFRGTPGHSDSTAMESGMGPGIDMILANVGRATQVMGMIYAVGSDFALFFFLFELVSFVMRLGRG
mmetsp:Transcript_26434/g.59861  ORF Transcript_26434/g.59861 Transcript_26434/m.59861 type:complete len:189 (+) Transcript_26434:26-592(+)